MGDTRAISLIPPRLMPPRQAVEGHCFVLFFPVVFFGFFFPLCG
jgi:hypothetical protein